MATAVDVPPSYDKAMEDAPPSYNSLFSDLKRTKAESDGNVNFAKNAGALICTVVCGSVIGLVCIGIGMAIPIAMIVLGSVHLHDCRAERYIPIYLIVAGSFGVFTFLVNLCRRQKQRRSQQEDGEDNSSSCFSGFMCLVSCFTLAWFIAGNVWVYRTHGEWSENPNAPNYCHPTLYWFSFWLITASYILAGIAICLGILGACFSKS